MNDDADAFDADGRLDGLSPADLVAMLGAIEERLADAPLAALSEDGLLALLGAREEARRKGAAVDAALYVEISDRGAYTRAGYNTMHQLYTGALRLGDGESRRRRVAAASIGRFTEMTGERREPAFPCTAAAVSEGAIGEAHVVVIDEVMDRIPRAVDLAARDKAEELLAGAARTLPPSALMTVGNRILAHLDPDGTLADDKERQRQRKFRLSPQDRQMMSAIQARLAPQLRAEFEVMFTLWAAPGMNNPDDPDSPFGSADQPGLDPAVLAAAAERDDRLLGQRQHDALLAMLQWVNAQAAHARPKSLRNQVVVSVTDEDLARQAGVAWTTTGTRMPVSDLVKTAADCVPWLAVFSTATGQVLYLGRAHRLASRAQRLALFARDRGCTAPGCTRPFSQCEVHHAPEWQDGGTTDIDQMGGACGKHNRAHGKNPGDWESTVLTDGPDKGRMAWRPVGADGPWIVNPLFHPDKIRTGLDVPEAERTPPPVLNHRLGHTDPPDSRTSGDVDAATESGVERLLRQHLAA
ncbi:HNH endonuclease signature motif containing protein [Gordonia sp. (in: high G+C Gram-positive bacteria)]|uniref:HNH endonuclease signature motif containing protein n=1 Tax=Gordonia sp. (in: high G+C Gram-positive bacteria) TaxID=84139 RepID=UPI00262CEFCD|nr:HNH endonuclease signature motif containing protein [Gordonia sp. (in: high G+C Gram-positive bacteria)]